MPITPQFWPTRFQDYKFMINCFYVQYNNEWDVTYNCVTKYVNTLVNAYYNATKDLQE